MEIIAYAKINIGLDVVGKLDNGYHSLKSVMQQVDLYDVITLSVREKPVVFLESNSNIIPLDATNLAYRAAELMRNTYRIEKGVAIYIDKRIPMAAGMAGGSTDAAAVIEGMNVLFDLKLSKEEMQRVGVKLGADIPFCLQHGCALCEGIGDVITPLNNNTQMAVLIAKPDIDVSTAHVYKSLQHDKLVHPDMNKVVAGITKGDLKTVCSSMGNVLESVTASEYEIIDALKASMIKCGAAGSLMSGSGPTVFGLFEDMKEAKRAEQVLKVQYPNIFVQAVNVVNNA